MYLIQSEIGSTYGHGMPQPQTIVSLSRWNIPEQSKLIKSFGAQVKNWNWIPKPSILLPWPLSSDPWFIQCIYHYNQASKRFVEVYLVHILKKKKKKKKKMMPTNYSGRLSWEIRDFHIVWIPQVNFEYFPFIRIIGIADIKNVFNFFVCKIDSPAYCKCWTVEAFD